MEAMMFVRLNATKLKKENKPFEQLALLLF